MVGFGGHTIISQLGDGTVVPDMDKVVVDIDGSVDVRVSVVPAVVSCEFDVVVWLILLPKSQLKMIPKPPGEGEFILMYYGYIIAGIMN